MYTEMKLMDLARRVYEANTDEVIDFVNGSGDDAEWYGGWMGIKKIEAFDNDNIILLIGHYGGEANTRLYALSEYDPRIGDFCEPRLRWCLGAEAKKHRQDIDFIECIAKAIADFLIDYWGSVSETIAVDASLESLCMEALRC